ncbi:hypothetical protein DL93DRAFT_2089215 [Clavulina sp. PMI_390]|nr:hypothetical protein DL93DRAFT_2089215 [Clavulina sp. PMI_390]
MPTVPTVDPTNELTPTFLKDYNVEECMHKTVPGVGRCTAGYTLKYVGETGAEEANASTSCSGPPSNGLAAQATVPLNPHHEGHGVTKAPLLRRSTRLSRHAASSSTVVGPSPTIQVPIQVHPSNPTVNVRKSSKRTHGKRPNEEHDVDSSRSKRRKSDPRPLPRGLHQYIDNVDVDPDWVRQLGASQNTALQLWRTRPFLISESAKTSPPPPQLFAKDSWSIPSRQEVMVHKDMHGQFGAAELYGYHKLDLNAFFFRQKNRITFWAIFVANDDIPVFDPNFRHAILVHWIIYFATVGKSLFTSERPRELLTTILHAMMAHFTMWRTFSLLHRDVSTTNIMRTTPRICRHPPLCPNTPATRKHFPTSHVYCEGLLVDADLVRRVDDKEIIEGKTISGTYTSLSRRLHQGLRTHDKLTHSPYDDVESSIWVLLLVLYEQAYALDLTKHLIKYQQLALDDLMSGDPDKIDTRKQSISFSPGKVFPQCPPLDYLIHEVLTICGQSLEHQEIDDKNVMIMYGRYLDSIIKCLNSQHPALAQRWETIYNQPFPEPKSELNQDGAFTVPQDWNSLEVHVAADGASNGSG